MRITCPSCHAPYEVPDTLFGAAARKVRCARCAFEWLPEPAAAAPAPPEAAPVQPAPVQPAPAEPVPVDPAPPEPPPRLRPEPRAERPLRPEALTPPGRVPPSSMRARTRPAPVLASLAVLAISLVVLISLGWAAYAWRTEVMHAWPPSQRVFAALGLA